MARLQAVIFVLDEVQMLDQEVAPARPVAEQGAHLGERRLVDLAALGMTAAAAPAVGRLRDWFAAAWAGRT